MKPNVRRQVNLRFRRQYGVMSRPELRAIGVTPSMEAARVRSGEWERPTPRVVRLAGSPASPHQDLMIAVLESGPLAVASHQSAAWLWDLVRPPDRHAVSIGYRGHGRPGPFVVHRLRGPAPSISFHGPIPSTNPLRTLVDLAGESDRDQLDDAIDRAVARRLVTVEGLKAELGRVGRNGRKGAGAMRAALRRRSLLAGPSPSVLESRYLRLMKQGGLEPMAVEVEAGPDGEYRIDSLLDPLVAVEVDGHIHHSTPEQKAYDEHRRGQIRLSGVFLLVYDWVAITRDGRRVLAECHQALARYGSGGRRLAD
ncbi:MAG TPA: hypothetical protein VFN68_12525 [Acidimicrobiales bacterium]|nr:hypothetical protein [Acidimicrobiales bacterium]